MSRVEDVEEVVGHHHVVLAGALHVENVVVDDLDQRGRFGRSILRCMKLIMVCEMSTVVTLMPFGAFNRFGAMAGAGNQQFAAGFRCSSIETLQRGICPKL